MHDQNKEPATLSEAGSVGERKLLRFNAANHLAFSLHLL